MRAWLAPLAAALRRGEAAILVHVVAVEGSAPREAGAQMLVGGTWLHGTIGGGQLEHTAMLEARAFLRSARAGIRRVPLGPDLSQCCGGSVTLAFEPFAPADLVEIETLIRAAGEPAPVLRTLRINAEGALRRDWAQADPASDFAVTLTGSPLHSRRVELSAALEIRERMNPAAQPLFLFGAGHVGRAVARALQPLGFTITWIDGRAGQFPEPPPEDVRMLALAIPELAVKEAPPGTMFLVMTHSHPLDEAICEAVLAREDFDYLGLIGSATKRGRFVKRLGRAGIPPHMLARLTCPIGLPGITSKEPAAIAASVAADLLLRREQDAGRQSAEHEKKAARHGR